MFPFTLPLHSIHAERLRNRNIRVRFAPFANLMLSNICSKLQPRANLHLCIALTNGTDAWGDLWAYRASARPRKGFSFSGRNFIWFSLLASRRKIVRAANDDHRHLPWETCFARWLHEEEEEIDELGGRGRRNKKGTVSATTCFTRLNCKRLQQMVPDRMGVESCQTRIDGSSHRPSQCTVCESCGSDLMPMKVRLHHAAIKIVPVQAVCSSWMLAVLLIASWQRVKFSVVLWRLTAKRFDQLGVLSSSFQNLIRDLKNDYLN